MIRLFVIEDHTTLIVSSLRFQFRPKRDGIVIFSSAANVDEAIQQADPELFDLFILDLYIPGFRPIDNIRKLRNQFPQKPIAIYTSETSWSWKNRMKNEGANAYITKNSTRDELKKAIQIAARGEFHFNLNDSTDPGSLNENLFLNSIKVSPNQAKIVKFLSEGLTHKEISDRTGLSRPMIEKLLKKMRTTLKVKNNLELITLLINKDSV